MSVLIGHAAIDENGKAQGGASGDQNKKEVCTREWYNKPWNVVLRCTDPAMAEKIAVACEKACANDKIGYDQWQRNSVYLEGLKVNLDLAKITVACESDCSSLVCTCAIAAGIPADKLYIGGNMRTTRNMRDAFAKTGKFQVLTDAKYLTSDEYLKRGDILLKEGSHTAIALENGSKIATPKPAVAPTPTTNSAPKIIGVATALTTMNVRNASNTSGKIVGNIAKGSSVNVLEIYSNGWYKIVWQNGHAYVSNAANKYFTYKANSISAASGVPYIVRITADALNVRAGAGTNHRINTVVHKNEAYTIVDE